LRAGKQRKENLNREGKGNKKNKKRKDTLYRAGVFTSFGPMPDQAWRNLKTEKI